jgi:L,D-transpeptidase ErfK/SrfK
MSTLTRRFSGLTGSLLGVLSGACALAGALALAVVFTPPAEASRTGDLIGQMNEYFTWKPDDDLLEIARADELGLIELMAANPGVDPWHPGREVRLTLPTMHIFPDAPRRGIVINTAELRLYYFDAEDGPVTFPLGVGRDGFLTPLGSTKVVRKKENPSWYLTPGAIRDNPDLPKVVPPGPDNPLGEHAIYLGWPTYLIHGTNTPWGIGRRTSRGCIRMYPEDIAWLYERVPVGTVVTVVDQPVKLGWQDGELFIEVQPSPMQVDKMEETSRSPGPADPIPVAQEGDRIIRVAGEEQARLDWAEIERALFERVGYPIRITAAAFAPEKGDAPVMDGDTPVEAPRDGSAQAVPSQTTMTTVR